jgi:hypothetical protein
MPEPHSLRGHWRLYVGLAFAGVFVAGLHFGARRWGLFAGWMGIAVAWLAIAYFNRRAGR